MLQHSRAIHSHIYYFLWMTYWISLSGVFRLTLMVVV
jgi:hypothetical protein